MKDIVQVFNDLSSKAMQNKVFAQLDKEYTYAQLNQDVSHLVGAFKAHNLVEGDRVILSSKNNYAVGSIFLACLRFGVTTVLLDPDVGPARANELIDICEPKGFFVDQSLVAEWSLGDRLAFSF
ncbi:MAG: AMP-binding protein, partial [Bacteroidota bacterium]